MSRQVERVVVGVSGSIANLAALRVAADRARESAAPLVAVTAWSPVGGELASLSSPCPSMLRAWADAAKARLHQAFQEAFGGVPVGVELQAKVVRAEPGRALVAAAGEPTDLLVIGAGPRAPMARLLHGGVVRYCLRHATCPVLCVPPPEMIEDLHRRRRWRDDELAMPPLARGSRP